MPRRPLCPACGEGTPKPAAPSSVPPASSGFASLPARSCSGHTPSSLPPQPWLCLGCTHANNNNVPDPPIHNTRLPFWVPRRGEPLAQSLLPLEHRIRPNLDPSCRWCQGDPETVIHLFEECPNLVGLRSAANILAVRALWDSLSSSLSFLRVVGVL